jgi:hypothetical protein
MSILNSILGAITGNSSTASADPLQVALSGLLNQNGGIADEWTLGQFRILAEPHIQVLHVASRRSS